MLMSFAQDGIRPPAHGCELASFLSIFFADGDDLLGRRDVVPRTVFNFIRRPETLG
jgi:hypothetical protein